MMPVVSCWWVLGGLVIGAVGRVTNLALRDFTGLSHLTCNVIVGVGIMWALLYWMRVLAPLGGERWR